MRSLLDLFHKSKQQTPPAALVIEVQGKSITVNLKRNSRARKLTLRMSRDGKSAIMTLPLRVSRIEAQNFAEKSRNWIATQLQHQISKVEIRQDAEFTLRGEPHRISLTGKARGLVLHDVTTRTIHVPGQLPHVNRRLTEWLKQEAKRELTSATEKYAMSMAATFTSIAIRDQKSRWGSCSSSGALSYSWRLILAPSYVLDYVAAHEVAHLREMNHSPRFWRLVLTHCPDTRKAKDWLKKNGRDLHRVT
jgi:predicted metal-dependent hydrolase